MILRPYQSAASDAIFREWQGNDSTLVVMPTGGGKTMLFADVIRRVFPRRALVNAHREELIFQAQDKIQRVTGLSADVEMGEYRVEGGLFGQARVVVSTIQTQCSGGDGGGRMSKFDPQRFGVLIIDEAHHATSPTYRRVIDYYRSNPALKVLGVTATPDRADEEALGQVFQSVAFDYEVLDAIHDGWLVPIEQQMVHVEGLDYSSIRTTAGDLNGGDLAAVMEAEKNLQQMASASLAIIGAPRQVGRAVPCAPFGDTLGAHGVTRPTLGPRALVFTASVRAAEMTAEIFNRHRAGMVSWVCGKTDREERRRVLAKQGIHPDGVSFSQGRQLISEIFRRWDGKLCSFKQAKVLRRYGYSTEVSFAEASATIDALAKNGWRKVGGPQTTDHGPGGDPARN